MFVLETDTQQYFAPFVHLRLTAAGVEVITPSPARAEPWHLVIVECFVNHPTVQAAFSKYGDVLRASRLCSDASVDLSFALTAESSDLLMFGKRVAICPQSSSEFAYRLAIGTAYSDAAASEPLLQTLRSYQIHDFSDFSRQSATVSLSLCRRYRLSCELPELNREEFSRVATGLFSEGMLTSPVNQVHLEQFRRYSSFCPSYGFSRGTPIDRFYLQQFTSQIAPGITGRLLELGGQNLNRERYGFTNVEEYVTVDVDPTSGADVIADIQERDTFPAGSFDIIIAFNVLEHCRQPWKVIDNIHHWLRPGGKTFCEVPNAQRIHRDPKDYWRILPDALEDLFSTFRWSRIQTYGNLCTLIAAHCGLAAEELEMVDLLRTFPEHPVISCVTAER
jgi:hypothetical protein